MFQLAGLNQFPDCTLHGLDRYVAIDPVLIQQVDTLELGPLERAFDRLLDVVPAGCSVPAAP